MSHNKRWHTEQPSQSERVKLGQWQTFAPAVYKHNTLTASAWLIKMARHLWKHSHMHAYQRLKWGTKKDLNTWQCLNFLLTDFFLSVSSDKLGKIVNLSSKIAGQHHSMTALWVLSKERAIIRDVLQPLCHRTKGTGHRLCGHLMPSSKTLLIKSRWYDAHAGCDCWCSSCWFLLLLLYLSSS